MTADPALGPLWYVAFLLSVTCHEAAHALAAKIGGDDTAYEAGQVSLNPVPHIRREPFGMVVVPLLSYFVGGSMIGWASAPFDPLWRDRHPRRAAWMALAGPAANVVIAILAAAAIHAGISAGIFEQPQSITFVSLVDPAPGEGPGLATFVSILFSLNLLLCAFNLIPLPPLDGSSALGLFVPQKALDRYHEVLSHPTAQIFGLLIAWELFGRIFPEIFGFGIALLYPGSSYR